MVENLFAFRILRPMRNYRPPVSWIMNFLNKTIEEWKDKIQKMGHKSRFGCQLQKTVANDKVVCLFQD
ncbi:hypothetical protein Y032_0210g2121 [Ancylostoma ceylanicum]|uniref:Uncharacterized protein n=1 Tax=Ancylostoma ceylanicum TaxID=53326 RepID=A0A016SKF6_9BILA|nr:hypothetical protein Y032_0210g2121 [Ancylostoma ceylanicum]